MVSSSDSSDSESSESESLDFDFTNDKNWVSDEVKSLKQKCFKTLELKGDDTDVSQIKKSYYRLAKKYHPDTFRPEPEGTPSKTFTDIQEAYELLTNDEAFQKRIMEIDVVDKNQRELIELQLNFFRKNKDFLQDLGLDNSFLVSVPFIKLNDPTLDIAVLWYAYTLTIKKVYRQILQDHTYKIPFLCEKVMYKKFYELRDTLTSIKELISDIKQNVSQIIRTKALHLNIESLQEYLGKLYDYQSDFYQTKQKPKTFFKLLDSLQQLLISTESLCDFD